MVIKNHDCVIAYNFEEQDIRDKDCILVTNNLNIIEIVEVFEYKTEK